MDTRSIALVMVMMSTAAVGADGVKRLPMPPDFSVDEGPAAVLSRYPLGVITKEAAFAHHGQAHDVVRLPNGLDGWVYENVLPKQETFSMPSGEKRDVQGIDHMNVISTYTLVLDSSGKVIDVLYLDNRSGDSASALLEQRKTKGDTGAEPWRQQHRAIE